MTIPKHSLCKLKYGIPSAHKPGYVHQVGTQGMVVESLGDGNYSVELRVADDDGAWYETTDVADTEIELLGAPKENTNATRLV